MYEIRTAIMTDAQARLELDRRLALLLPIAIAILSLAGLGSIVIGMYQWRPAPCVGAAFAFASAWICQRWLRQVRVEIGRLKHACTEPAVES